MRALVTGGTGFIGSVLVERLLREGMQVTCVVRPGRPRRWLATLPVTCVSWDYRDISALADAVAAADLVFHVAGVTKARKRSGYIHGNYQVTQSLLAACAAYGPPRQRLVFISSLAAAGPSLDGHPRREEEEPTPVSHYGQSKLLAEKAVLDFSRHRAATIIRPAVVYGPRDRELLGYFKSIQWGVQPLPRREVQGLSLVYVEDLVEGILLAVLSPQAPGRIYYLCDDEHYDWRQIGSFIAGVLQRSPVILPVPLWLLRSICLVAGGAAWLTGEAPYLNPDKYKEMSQVGWICSNARARSELGFAPATRLLAGLASTAAWYRRQGWL